MNAIVKINLNIFQEKFIRKEFDCLTGPVKVTRTSDIGKFIYSTVQWTKERPLDDDKVLSIILPDSNSMHPEFFWAYLTKEREKWISDFIQSSFNLNLDLFFAKGYRQNYRQKDIANAFIYHYGLPDNMETWEMILKRDFRKRKNIRKIIAENILK